MRNTPTIALRTCGSGNSICLNVLTSLSQTYRKLLQAKIKHSSEPTKFSSLENVEESSKDKNLKIVVGLKGLFNSHE